MCTSDDIRQGCFFAESNPRHAVSTKDIDGGTVVRTIPAGSKVFFPPRTTPSRAYLYSIVCPGTSARSERGVPNDHFFLIVAFRVEGQVGAPHILHVADDNKVEKLKVAFLSPTNTPKA